MQIGKPQRVIIVEPLELPVGNPELSRNFSLKK